MVGGHHDDLLTTLTIILRFHYPKVTSLVKAPSHYLGWMTDTWDMTLLLDWQFCGFPECSIRWHHTDTDTPPSLLSPGAAWRGLSWPGTAAWSRPGATPGPRAITGIVTQSDPTCHRDRRVWRNQDSWHYLRRSALQFADSIRASGLLKSCQTLWQNSHRDMTCDAETSGSKLPQSYPHVSSHFTVNQEISVTERVAWHVTGSDKHHHHQSWHHPGSRRRVSPDKLLQWTDSDHRQ